MKKGDSITTVQVTVVDIDQNGKYDPESDHVWLERYTLQMDPKGSPKGKVLWVVDGFNPATGDGERDVWEAKNKDGEGNLVVDRAKEPLEHKALNLNQTVHIRDQLERILADTAAVPLTVEELKELHQHQPLHR